MFVFVLIMKHKSECQHTFKNQEKTRFFSFDHVFNRLHKCRTKPIIRFDRGAFALSNCICHQVAKFQFLVDILSNFFPSMFLSRDGLLQWDHKKYLEMTFAYTFLIALLEYESIFSNRKSSIEK